VKVLKLKRTGGGASAGGDTRPMARTGINTLGHPVRLHILGGPRGLGDVCVGGAKK
jgi:hypothetical protein